MVVKKHFPTAPYNISYIIKFGRNVDNGGQTVNTTVTRSITTKNGIAPLKISPSVVSDSATPLTAKHAVPTGGVSIPHVRTVSCSASRILALCAPAHK